MASPLPEDDFGPDLEQLGAIGGLKTRGEGYIPNIQSAYGSIIQNAPDYQYFTAPLSNRGRTTASYGGQNNLVVAPNTPIRVVDNRTGEVIYSGTGYEGAQSAINAAKALSASGGSKANWDIQVSGPGSSKFESVSTERPDDMVGKVAGMALPIAVGFIPGLQGLGAVLASTAAGAGGAALSGNNILKGALMGGLSAAGGQLLGPQIQGFKDATGKLVATNLGRAVGTGVGSTVGGLATGQNLQNSLLGGVLSGGTTYLGGELMGAGKPQDQALKLNNPGDLAYGNTGAASAGLADRLNVIGQNAAAQLASAGLPTTSFSVFSAPSVAPSFADKAQSAGRGIAEGGIGNSGVELAGLDPNAITVTGQRIPGFSGSAFTPSFFDSASDFSVKPEGVSTSEEKATPSDDEILVNARPTATTGSSAFTVGAPNVNTNFSVPENIIVEAQKPADTSSSTVDVKPATTTTDSGLTQDEIKVTAKKPAETTSTAITIPGDVTVPQDIIDLANKDTTTADDKSKFDVKKALALLALLGGGSGGGGGSGTGTGTGKLQSIFSAKLPTPGEGGSLKVGGLKGPTLGAAGTYSARPVTDWYRYGMGPAMDIPAGTDLSGATSPYAGYGPGTLGQETFKAVSGVPEQPTGMSHGGPMGYARGSSRESFAVNGPGTGRSDDIPAVLSDGEYVIDAETVALLGDGSSKAGAKKLDQMRVNIRKHKGRNLAKGKFSVNAKRPEKYLSGGRA